MSITVASGKRGTYKATSAVDTFIINDDTKGATITNVTGGDIIAIEGFAADFTAKVSGRTVTLTSTVDTAIVVKFQLANATGATASVRFLDGDLTATYTAAVGKTKAHVDLGTQLLTTKAVAVSDAALGANDSVSTFDETSGGGSSSTGTTFTLTIGADLGAAFTGTSGDDTFIAGDTTATTWTVGDELNGGSGTDTLKVIRTAAITKPTAATVTNIETVSLTSGATVVIDTTTGFSGLTSLTTSGSGGETVTAAATTAISVTDADAAATAEAIAVDGGLTVAVTSTNNKLDTITIGAATAAAGAVTVSSSSKTTAANADTMGAIAVTGGTSVTVTQVAANQATTNIATIAGAVTVTGDANTTTVSVKDTAAAAGFTKTSTIAGVVGHTNGAVTIADVNAASATAAGKLATVTLGGFAAATIDSSALATVNLSGTGTSLGMSRGALTATPTSNTLTVNLNGLTLSGALTDSEAAADDGFTTVNIASSTTESTLGSLVIADATTLNISGDALFTSGAETLTSITDITVTNTAGADLATALGTAVNFTGGSGADTISIGTTTKAITLGAGDDTVTTSSAAVGTGGSVAAGAGTGDKIIMTDALAAGADGSSTFNTKFTGFEILQISDAMVEDALDLDGINAVTKVILAAGATTATIGNIVSGGTVQFNTTNSTGTTTINVKSAVVAATDVLNLAIVNSGDVYAAATVLVANVERINISGADLTTTGSAATINTMTLQATSATSVYVTGNSGLNLTNSGNIAITLFDASAVTNNDSAQTALLAATTDTDANLGVTFLSANTTTANGVTIKGGAGADTLTGVANIDAITGGNGADTINGGLGADVITLTETTAAIDIVIITGGLTADSITGFTTGTGGDKIQLDISDLETASAVVSAVTFSLDDLVDGTTPIGAAAVTIQEVADQAGGVAVAAAGAATLYVLLTETYANVAAVETGLETGDHELTVHANAGTSDAFMVLWSDGTDVYLSSMYLAVDSGADFLAGDLVGTNLAKLVGNASIAASEFVAGNFAFIA